MEQEREQNSYMGLWLGVDRQMYVRTYIHTLSHDTIVQYSRYILAVSVSCIAVMVRNCIQIRAPLKTQMAAVSRVHCGRALVQLLVCLCVVCVEVFEWEGVISLMLNELNLQEVCVLGRLETCFS